MSKIVVALGGNALGITVEEQLEKTRLTSIAIADLIEKGHTVVLAHGNGPQVGQIRLAFENGHEQKIAPFMPFPECIALSQGYIGYHLQQSIDIELRKRKIEKPVVTIVTQILVDKKDEAFLKPTKPIGAYYDEKTANELMKSTGDTYMEDAGRGYRRCVPSPKPQGIHEIETVKTLVNANSVVIACGGGGVPIIEDGISYKGVDAVVDKDFASACLAESLDFDTLFILTAVDHVAINFNKDNQVDLLEMNVSECKKHIENNEFAPGSMLPKVEACMRFVENESGNKKRRAIIGALEKASLSIDGKSGTLITK